VPPYKFGPLAAGALLAALALGSPVSAQHGDAPPSAKTQSMQGDQQAWINDPHIHAFYDAVVAASAHGAAKVDVPALETKSRAIFRAFAVSKGMDPKGMEDHLAAIPRQVVEIAKEDPHVLDSYDNFVAAVFGPQ
jgi:hypothetical protein